MTLHDAIENIDIGVKAITKKEAARVIRDMRRVLQLMIGDEFPDDATSTR